jgi:ankyrin repeat protein
MGVDPNTQDNVGWTPLHVAVAKGNSEAIKLLVSAGADAHAGNANGVTPIQLAKAVHPDVLETLSHIR